MGILCNEKTKWRRKLFQVPTSSFCRDLFFLFETSSRANMYFSYFFTGFLVVALFGQATLAAPAVEDVLSGMTIEEMRDLKDYVERFMNDGRKITGEIFPVYNGMKKTGEIFPVYKEAMPVAKEKEEEVAMPVA